jgi:hypothetical protein
VSFTKMAELWIVSSTAEVSTEGRVSRDRRDRRDSRDSGQGRDGKEGGEERRGEVDFVKTAELWIVNNTARMSTVRSGKANFPINGGAMIREQHSRGEHNG